MNKKNDLDNNWKSYLPLKYVCKFEVRETKEVMQVVKSRIHQTSRYKVEPFYKVISKIHPDA